MAYSVWRERFDSYAPRYMNEVFTADSVREVKFLVEVLDVPAGARILDVGCGTGRHVVELARPGYRVTGLDLSAGMLAEAAEAAEAAGEAGVEIELVQAGVTAFSCARGFDAAAGLCEGAFTLVAAADPFDRDLAILRNVLAALKPNAPFVLTASNGMRLIRSATSEQVEAGRFDPLRLLCRMAGFEVEHVRGGTAGAWGRRLVDLDEWEIMVVMRKPAA